MGYSLAGASRGFGLELVKRILARGDCVIATARDVSRLDPLFAQPDTDNSRIIALELDVTWSSDALQETAKKAISHWGRVDVVVNKAGSNTIFELEGLSERKARDIFSAQLWGPARVQEIVSIGSDLTLILN